MGGRGATFSSHTKHEDDNVLEKAIPIDWDDPESKIHNQIFKILKAKNWSTRESTDSLDEKIINHQQEQINNISSEYSNILKHHTNEIHFGIQKLNKYGVLGIVSGRLLPNNTRQYKLVLNTSFINKDGEKVRNEIKNSIQTGDSVPINLLRSKDYVVTHEMGHVIENALYEKLRKENPKFRNISDKDIALDIKNKIVDRMKKQNYNLQDKDIYLSEYAKTNPREWFAETFTDLKLADKPKQVSLELGKFLKENNIEK